MIIRFTHTIEIDWWLPGIAPTGKRVECATVSIIQFRDGKLFNEHIYWDQASVLVQLGLLDSSKLPVVGVETARKVVDFTLPSNRIMERAGNSRAL
jgi:carboxymethylenebutenolidase